MNLATNVHLAGALTRLGNGGALPRFFVTLKQIAVIFLLSGWKRDKR